MEKWFQNKSFSTEKREQGIKARKGHRGINARKIHRDIKAWKLHRAFGILLAAALVFQTVPFEGIAVSASESSGGGLCEHHTEHMPDCGYKEAEPGQACTHEHTEDCYRTVEGEDGSTTRELDCHHEHDESCGYREEIEGHPCTFECEICNEGTDGTPEDNTKDNEINDGDSENPGTENGDEVKEPDDGQEECICEEQCTEDNGNGGCRINTDCPVCGAEDASLSDCKGKDTEDSTEDAEENTDQPEDTGICKHHPEHDDACGCLPESEDSEGSPCTYECRICPIEDLIAALPDEVTEENADEVRAQLDEILALFGELTEDEQRQIDLSCCYVLQEALDNANAPMLADGHDTRQDGDEASVTIDTETLYYATLEEAFSAANGKTATITMLENAECEKNDSTGSPLNITSGNVTLNMNGKTLSGIGFGSYGIINIDGGFLSVQGNGSIEVRFYGISSRGGTLAVTETAFNLTGENGYCANNGVLNKGGTVIINSGTFSGVSDSLGQINHESGNTTINHAEMTGTTADNPVGLVYSEKGTLTINGGTFSNITVEENNFAKVNSVAEFLGKGCAFKHQNGTWVTDEEMAGKTLDNVTVQKIPLTINPQSETSWYYNSSPHTLAMNAAPVDSGVISYVWKNGTDTLDCTTDNYEIPADMPAGSYTYTCEATCDGYTLFHKFSFEILKSGTHFVGDGTVKTYKDGAGCSDFTVDDTITVKATPTATGQAPTKAAARLRGNPAAGQMAVFVGDNQVSDAVEASGDGSYTMTVNAADVLEQGNVEPNGGPVTLTAKFVGNDNMADAYGTVDVKISAVAKVVKGGTTTYVGALANAFIEGNDGAIITLLSEADLGTNYIRISYSCTFTLDLNGQTVKASSYGAFYISGGSITIQDSGTGGKIESPNITIEVNSGTLSVKSGTVSGFYGVRIISGTVNISGGAISGNETGLFVDAGGNIALSGGTYNGKRTAIMVDGDASVSLKDMLATGYAYHQNDIPVAKAEGLVGDYEAGEVPLDAKPAWLTGTVTVKECQHNGEGVCTYTHTSGITTHQKTCLACGNKWDEENCSFGENGKCACEAVLAVTLSDNLNLTYTGTAQTPAVTVTVDGQTLATDNYSVAYSNNINAGENTAKVTVSGKSFTGTVTKTFTIEKAEQKDFAATAVTKQYEKNGIFTLSTTGGSGDGAVLYRVPENNGVLMVNGDKATIIGVGTVTVTATKAESDNYKAATATGKMTIEKAPAPAIDYPAAAGSITYGQKLSDCALTGGSTEYGTFAWENGNMVPTMDNTGYTVVFTASEETKKNYETITNTTKSVSVKVVKAVPAVSVTAAVSGSKDNRQAVLTVNVAKAGAGAFPTGTVTFIDCTGSTEVEIGTATLSNGSASYTWDRLLDQTYTIKAVYAGNAIIRTPDGSLPLMRRSRTSRISLWMQSGLRPMVMLRSPLKLPEEAAAVWSGMKALMRM